MNTRQARTLEAFQRALSFTTTLPDKLGIAKVTIVPLRTELAAVVGRLQAHGAAQDFGRRHRAAGGDRVEMLLTTIRRTLMQPVADLAPQLLSSSTAGLGKALTMPPRRLGPTGLIAAATAMADGAEPHLQLFVDKGGLEPDFVQRLRDAAQQLAAAVEARANERGRVAGATAGVRADVRRGRHVIEMLDTVISAELADDPVRLRTWKTAKRIIELVGGSGGNGGGVTPAGPAVPVAA